MNIRVSPGLEGYQFEEVLLQMIFSRKRGGKVLSLKEAGDVKRRKSIILFVILDIVSQWVAGGLYKSMGGCDAVVRFL